jgi:very-short-patch-repair endonuclease
MFADFADAWPAFRVRSRFVPMDSRCDAVLGNARIEALLREPLVSWPEASPVAAREIVESTHGVETAILAVVVDAVSLGRSDLKEQVIEALSEAVAGTYPAWLPEAEHLAGPGGAGLAAVRTICERVAGNSDLFGPFLLAAAEASLCGRPLGVAEFAQETVIRQARKLILRAYGYRHVVIMVELTGTWSTAQIEAVEANALWLAGPGELTVWLFGTPTAFLTRVPRSSLPGSVPTSDPPATPRAPYLTPLRGRPNAFSRAERRLEAHLARSPWATGRAWNQTWSSGVLANSIRVDLVWPREKCVVELDGPDHLDMDKYAADRVRDRALQRAGFLVLRYTNDEVLGDVARVLDELERFLKDRRRSTARET